MFRIRTVLINCYLAGFDLVIALACSFWVCSFQAPSPLPGPATALLKGPAPFVALGVSAGLWLGVLGFLGMYRSRRMDSAFADLSALAKAALVGFLLMESLARPFPALELFPSFLPRFLLATFLVEGLARVSLRMGLRELRRRGYNTKNLVVVASRDLAERLTEKISRRAYYGYRIVRQITYGAGEGSREESVQQEFDEVLSRTAVNDVILALPADARALTARLVDACESRGIHVRVVPDLFPIIQSDTQVYDFDGIPLVNVRLYPTEYFGYVILKRAFDLGVSLAFLILSSPIYLLIALLVKLASPGPVFFVQERVGLNGKRFKMLKFRTMVDSNARNADVHRTTSRDSNVTPLGRWLRKSNLDELPQFLNVLNGDMSIVGPRPERPFYIERFRQEIPDYMLRHYAKSGITGWAQVNGWRGDTSIPDRVAHDLYYIRHWTFALDVKILFLTLTRTFFHRNAY